ncbi:MAG: hypothetical protein MZV70_29720 [Desulfobacterales bacterium]|nr:hypothetical protein [Desulfobacterales bacterium]
MSADQQVTDVHGLHHRLRLEQRRCPRGRMGGLRREPQGLCSAGSGGQPGGGLCRAHAGDLPGARPGISPGNLLRVVTEENLAFQPGYSVRHRPVATATTTASSAA